MKDWREDGPGEYLHATGKWRITPCWTGIGVELFERAGLNPYPWSVHRVFDSPEAAAAYVTAGARSLQ